MRVIVLLVLAVALLAGGAYAARIPASPYSDGGSRITGDIMPGTIPSYPQAATAGDALRLGAD